MEFVNLSEKEFDKYSIKHLDTSFFQTSYWGKLKSNSGWKYHFLGIKNDGKIIAASLVLEKKLIANKKIFYAPRGMLCDYKDKEVLKFFTINIKKFVKDNGGILFKIDPYIVHKERDIDGNIVKNGLDNTVVLNNLKELGYKHLGFNLHHGKVLQERWMYTLDVKNNNVDDLMKKMESKTRQIIRKNERSCINIREINKDELEIFKDIMQHTGERRNFSDRPLSYLESMWDNLYNHGLLKVLFAEINFNSYYDSTKNEIDELTRIIKDRQYKKDNNILKMNEEKYLSSQEKDKASIERLNNQLKNICELRAKYGDIKVLGGIMFLVYGKEVLSLYGGSFKELMQFQSAYNLHWEMIKYACVNGFDRYNFYGISGDFNPNNPMYGLYVFKRSFGGQVVELIGEFDLVTNKLWYYIYNTAMWIKQKLR